MPRYLDDGTLYIPMTQERRERKLSERSLDERFSDLEKSCIGYVTRAISVKMLKELLSASFSEIDVEWHFYYFYYDFMGLKFFCDDYDENEFAFLVDPCGKGAFVNMYSLLDDKIFILQSVEESDSDYSFILPRNIATLCPQT